VGTAGGCIAQVVLIFAGVMGPMGLLTDSSSRAPHKRHPLPAADRLDEKNRLGAAGWKVCR
jgi:hypothetical protein